MPRDEDHARCTLLLSLSLCLPPALPGGSVGTVGIDGRKGRGSHTSEGRRGKGAVKQSPHACPVLPALPSTCPWQFPQTDSVSFTEIPDFFISVVLASAWNVSRAMKTLATFWLIGQVRFSGRGLTSASSYPSSLRVAFSASSRNRKFNFQNITWKKVTN